MKKKILSFALAMVLILGLGSAVTASAADYTASDSDIEFFSDGSYMVTETIEEIPLFTTFSTTSTKTGSKSSTYYDGYGVALWKITVTGTFTYTGTSATCTAVSHSRTIYDTSWSMQSQTSSRSSNTATTSATMQKKVLGIVTGTLSRTTTMTCDKNGNLS